MKKIFNSLMLCALLFVGQTAMAESWCEHELYDNSGTNPIYVSLEEVTANQLYRITVYSADGKIRRFHNAVPSITYTSLSSGESTTYTYNSTSSVVAADVTHSLYDINGDEVTFNGTNEGATFIVEFASSTQPVFGTYFGVRIGTDNVSYSNNASMATLNAVTWGACIPDNVVPVMTSATLVANSETYQGADITVEATDVDDEGASTTVTKFKVMNGDDEVGTFTASEGVITVTGLDAETLYTVTVYAVDASGNVSEEGIDVTFTTEPIYWCGETLSTKNGTYPVEVTLEIRADNLYRISAYRAEGDIDRWAAAKPEVTYTDVVSGETITLILNDSKNTVVSDDGTLIYTDIESSTQPVFTEQILINIDGNRTLSPEVEELNAVTWGDCGNYQAPETTAPEMTSATLVVGSETYQGADINVEATDLNDDGESTIVTNFKVMNGTDEVVGTFTASEGVITVTGLDAETTYTVTVYAVDASGNVSTTGIDVTFTTPIRIDTPQTAAPTPENDEDDVLSVYSNNYQAIMAFEYGSWGQSTTCTTVTVEDDEILKLSSYDFLGFEFTNTYDLSNYVGLHFDVWAEEMTSITVTPISIATYDDDEKSTTYQSLQTVEFTEGEWNSVNIPLSQFDGVDFENIKQMKFAGGSGSDVVYIDNIYYYKNSSTTVVGVENSSVSTVAVYPNPATDFMIVEAESAIELVTVYNIMGQTISSTVGGGQSATISVAGLSVGNYIVRVQTADGSVSMHKLIKQ